jgi:hypothetical protein
MAAGSKKPKSVPTKMKLLMESRVGGLRAERGSDGCMKGKGREEKGLILPELRPGLQPLPRALHLVIGLELANPAYPMHIACR